MKVIKLFFLKKYNILTTLFLALLGFSTACDLEGGSEYGTPHAKFIVKGKIKSSANNNALPGIRVVMQNSEHLMYGDTTFSDTDGNYEITDNWGSPTDQTYSLKFEDVDGETNGEFTALDTVVEFKDPVFSGGDDDWYKGKIEKELNVEINPENDS